MDRTNVERALSTWLEPGPVRAPAGPVERAIAHAAAHPRQRPATILPWPIPFSVRPRIRPHGPSWQLASVAAVVMLLVVAVALSVWRSLPTPSLPGRVAVTGAESCLSVRSPGTVTQRGQVTEIRSQVLSCLDHTSDPRTSGTAEIVVNEDRNADGSANLWGTYSLTGAAGGWSGPWTGTVTADGVRSTAGVFHGSGAYAGLEYRQTVSGGERSIDGSIGPTGAGAVRGGEECGKTAEGAQTGPAEWAGITLSCVVTSDDARLAGAQTLILNDIDRPDGTADLWGTTVFANSTGSWKGNWSGIIGRNSGWQLLSAVLRGRGGYDGLVWALTGFGPAGGHIDLSGSIMVIEVGGVAPQRVEGVTALHGRLECRPAASTTGPSPSRSASLPAPTQLTCRLDTTDPRASGAVEADTYEAKGYQALPKSGAVAVISGPDGTWQGGWTGWRSAASDGWLLDADAVFRGTGSFEGLELMGKITGAGLTWSFDGSIGPWR